MIISGNGYSYAQFNRHQREEIALKIATYLPQVMKHTGADSVAVMGKSGIAIAFAALVIKEFPILTVRKDNEMSHGDRVEGTEGHDFKNYLILDDFVATGSTVRNIVRSINEFCQARYMEAPRCVGVVEYLQTYVMGKDRWLSDSERMARSIYVGASDEYSDDGYYVPIFSI